jgi:hypothetical protein
MSVDYFNELQVDSVDPQIVLAAIADVEGGAYLADKIKARQAMSNDGLIFNAREGAGSEYRLIYPVIERLSERFPANRVTLLTGDYETDAYDTTTVWLNGVVQSSGYVYGQEKRDAFEHECKEWFKKEYPNAQTNKVGKPDVDVVF